METQKEFRDRLNLYRTEGQNDDSSAIGMGGYSGGVPGMGGAMLGSDIGMSRGTMEGKLGTKPGLLGWEPAQYPLKIDVSRSGRWFEWAIFANNATVHPAGKAPTLPSVLQRFHREPGPWMAITNLKAATSSKDWIKAAEAFSSRGRLQWYLRNEEASNLSSETLAPELVTKVQSEMQTLEKIFEQSKDSMLNDEAQMNQQLEAEQYEKLVWQMRSGSPAEVEAAFHKFVALVPPEYSKVIFLPTFIFSTITNTDATALRMSSLTDVTVEDAKAASGLLSPPGDNVKIPITFINDGGWKIDSIGTAVDLQESMSHAWQNLCGRSTQTVIDGLKTSMAAGHFSETLHCLTEDVRDEWIAEILIAASVVQRQGSPLVGRWDKAQADEAEPRWRPNSLEPFSINSRICNNHFRASWKIHRWWVF